MKTIGVGVIGFGTVGAGVVEGLLKNHDLIAQRLGIDVVLRRIGDLDTTTDRHIEGGLPGGLLTADAFEVINDSAVDIVVELIGGCGIAKKVVTEALSRGKPVVTANKKLLAEFGDELFSLAAENNADIYFGAAVGGTIPIIRVLREGLAGNNILSMHGILNGTCNYILTRMENEGIGFSEVLADAQRLGYAEANPSLDIDGFDTAHKALILATLAYGMKVSLDEITVEGIRDLDSCDVKFAAELGYRIKLLAAITRNDSDVEIRVAPTLVRHEHMLASVNGVFNAVMVSGDLSGDTLYYGRGAGRAPTASTVVGDICDIARNLALGGARHKRAIQLSENAPKIRPIEETCTPFYLRLMVADSAGMLGQFATILGKHGVSIAAVSQRQDARDGVVPIVVITHAAREANLNAALEEIVAAKIVTNKPVRLRILGK